MTRIDEATLSAIEKELATDGVWVAPELRTQVTPADEAAIQAAVGRATTPTYVVLVDLDPGDPLTNGDADQLASVIRDDTGRDGVYVGLAPRYGDDGYTLELTSFPHDYELFYAARVAAAEHPDDLTAQTVRTLDLLRSGKAPELYEKLDPSQRTGSTTAAPPDRHDGGPGTGVVVGSVSALLLVVVLAVVVRAALRRRRLADWSAPRPAGRPFTLPPAVLSTVRAAEDERHERRAQDDVEALAEVIDAADLGRTRPAALASFQAALDHYDVARRILDRDHSPADTVGAIVLAGRGRAAARAALEGRVWRPEWACYFNPLHAGPTSQVRWRDDRLVARVPACTACARAVRAGTEPDDVLDFVADRHPVHYFKLDLGAWSETGYGALDPDLLTRLLRTGSAS